MFHGSCMHILKIRHQHPKHASCFAEPPVHFALLLPMTGNAEGTRVAGAAALAVKRVNADKKLLPGRVLEYHWADSGCSPQQALAAMGKLLGKKRINAVIGCSAACEVTSYSGKIAPEKARL